MNVAVAIRQELKRELAPTLRRVSEPAKVIAFKVGNTPRAVEAHRQDEELPRLDVGLAYGRLYPEVKALYLKLMDAEMGESGEDPNVVLYEIQRMIAQKLAGRR